MKGKSKSIKYILINVIIITGIFITISMTWQSDPISVLLKQTNDPNLKEKIIIFKKGGYQKSLNYEKHDVEAIINAAKVFIGTPHQMGGLTKKGIDCSGLVMIAHQENEILMPHDGNEQARFGEIILSVKDLKRGDLVFFHSTYTTDKLVTHSGIYLGDKQFIHVSSKKGTSVADITSKYWAEHFLFGTRF